jgi:hypothetical protein
VRIESALVFFKSADGACGVGSFFPVDYAVLVARITMDQPKIITSEVCQV